MSFTAISNPRKSDSVIVVKARLGDDMRKFRFNLVYDLNVDYSSLRSRIGNLFAISDEFRIKYKDNEDMITICTLDDFKECVTEYLQKSTTLYLHIYQTHKPAHLSVTSTQSSIAGSWRFVPAGADGTVSGVDTPKMDVDNIEAVEAVSPETGASPDSGAETKEKPTYGAKEKDAAQVGIIDAGTTSACTPRAPADSVVERAETTTEVDVEEALRFVGMVNERFHGDERAKKFLKIGADYHDKRISRVDFHETCLGLFAEDDDLMDAFLSAFKIGGDDENTTERRAEIQPKLVTPASGEDTGDRSEHEEETTMADTVSPVAFMVNELQYARLLVQTRLQSLWRTHKQINRDIEPAMTELKEFVRKDIIDSAREETHRLLNQARRAHAEIPPADELVAAVVQGLQQANDIAVEATRDVTQSVCQVVRDAVHHESGAGTRQSAKEEKEDEEGPVQSGSVSKSPVPSEDVERETLFSIGASPRRMAAAQQEEKGDDFPAAAAPMPEKARVSPPPVTLPEVKEAPTGVHSTFSRPASLVDETSDSISNDSFIMVSKSDDDRLSDVSISKPGLEAIGEGDAVSGEPETPTAATAAMPTEPQSEPTYHQKAAGVESSEVITNLFILFDMGFQDFDTNQAVLDDFENNLQKAVAELCEREEAKK